MRLSMGAALSGFKNRGPGHEEKTLARGEHNATVIAIAAQKGGVGKTTTSVTLASAWARFHGKKVLLIDLDPQGHVNLAMREQIELGGGAISDILGEPSPLEVHEIRTGTCVDNLFVTPADPQLLGTEDRMSSRIGKEMVLKKALEITRSHYDIIVVDCPPNIGSLTVNALVAADQVLIPTNPAALGLAGVAGLMNIVHEVRALNVELLIGGIIMTRLDGRNTRSNEAVMELVEDNFGDMLIPTHIGVSDALGQAQLSGQDIYEYDANCRGAQQYKDLAAHLLQRLEIE